MLRLTVTSTLVFWAIGGTFAAAQPNAAGANRPSYLSLGDSLAFGYDPTIQPPDLSRYTGYPRLLSGWLRLDNSNASCPGESSGTFTGDSSEYYPGFDCAAMRSDGLLFVPYNGAANQLEYAVNWLKSNPRAKLVTLNIGGNDLGLLEYRCTAATPSDPQAVLQCEISGLPGVLGSFAANLGGILTQLRATGYKGVIVVLNYFAFNYADPNQVAAFTALNGVISTVAAPFHATVADSYRAFQFASLPKRGDTCQAGLLVKLPDGSCDTHPSLAGQNLLAGSVLVSLSPALKQALSAGVF